MEDFNFGIDNFPCLLRVTHPPRLVPGEKRGNNGVKGTGVETLPFEGFDLIISGTTKGSVIDVKQDLNKKNKKKIENSKFCFGN